MPLGLKGYVIPVDKAVEAYKNPKYDTFKTLFLFTNPKDVLRAVKGGIPFKSVNLGGKCFKDGDTLISQAVAINAEDVAAITGMAAGLDEAQFHRPVVACTLTGIVLGDPTTGIILGGTLEMMALGWMNVGAAMAPDAALASTVSTVLVIVGHQSIGAGIALAVPLAAAGQVLTIFVRTITVFFQHLADKYAEEANLRGIEICHVAGLLLQALRVAIPTVAIAMVAGTDIVNEALNSIPEVITRGLQVTGGFIVVGYAMVINLMNAQKLMVYFFLGFLIAVFTDVNLIGFGAIGAICAYFHITGMKKDIAIEEAAKTGGGSAVEGDDIDDSDLM